MVYAGVWQRQLVFIGLLPGYPHVSTCTLLVDSMLINESRATWSAQLLWTGFRALCVASTTLRHAFGVLMHLCASAHSSSQVFRM